ncbi:putative enoyl-CoA hydratase 1 [compost metagenome]
MAGAFEIRGIKMGVNYGLNKVRFIKPVPVDSRLRGHFKLAAWDPLDGGAQLTYEMSIEIEGADKPVCVAESIVRCFA